MKPQKFIASTTRAALVRVRETLGEDAVILSNRSTPQGVEVVAIAEREFESMVADPGTPASAGRSAAPVGKRPSIADQIASQLQGLKPPSVAVGPLAAMASQAAADAPAPPAGANTASPGAAFPWEERTPTKQQFSFIDFVRGRRPAAQPASGTVDHVLRADVAMAKAAVADRSKPSAGTLFERVSEPVERPVASPLPRQSTSSLATPDEAASPAQRTTATATNRPHARSAAPVADQGGRALAKSESTTNASDAAHGAAGDRRTPDVSSRPVSEAVFDEREILDELRTLRALVQGNLTGAGKSPPVAATKGGEPVAPARNGNPESSRLPGSTTVETLRRELLSSGFTPDLAEEALNGMSATLAVDEARDWMVARLASLLMCGTALDDVVEAGGVYAVTGPTGVGKTTTAAKLAARCAVRYGAASVGLITTDTYRIGAPDQLRIYGKILGVPVHTVHDHEWLQRVLEGMSECRLVLVDTIGMGQRDARIGRTLDLLDAFRIRRLLLVAAASQPEMHDEVLDFYRGASAAGVVLTKIDEAVKVAPALGTLMRRRIVLRYLTNGQRVPEDLHIPDPANLVRTALRADGRGMPARSTDARPAPVSLAR